MAVVEECRIGNTRIRVHDDCYRNKTKEEIQEAWHEFETAVAQALMAKGGKKNGETSEYA